MQECLILWCGNNGITPALLLLYTLDQGSSSPGNKFKPSNSTVVGNNPTVILLSAWDPGGTTLLNVVLACKLALLLEQSSINDVKDSLICSSPRKSLVKGERFIRGLKRNQSEEVLVPFTIWLVTTTGKNGVKSIRRRCIWGTTRVWP